MNIDLTRMKILYGTFLNSAAVAGQKALISSVVDTIRMFAFLGGELNEMKQEIKRRHIRQDVNLALSDLRVQ